MATPNYDINYNDERFREVESDKKVALSELEKTYAGMIKDSDKYYQAQIDASKEWAETQKKNQQEQTDFTIEQIEQQEEQTHKDYLKEQSGAYVDWQKQSNQYGVNAEQMAAQGMTGTGYRESSQVSMYNTYQNRVATARETYNRAVLNYDNAIKDARLQNNSALAEIAYQALQTQLELSLEGFQYKNQLILAKADKKMEVENTYYGRYKDVLNQINTENAMAEEVRQFNENQALKEKEYEEGVRRFNAEMAYKNAALAEEKRQFNVAQAAKSSSGGGGSSSGGSVKKSSGSSSVKKSPTSTKAAVNAKNSKYQQMSNANNVSNRHTDSWVEIPGHGRFSWTEVYAHVKDGTIKETKTSSGLKYTWVGKQAKNVTPDKKGYAAKQKDLMGY